LAGSASKNQGISSVCLIDYGQSASSPIALLVIRRSVIGITLIEDINGIDIDNGPAIVDGTARAQAFGESRSICSTWARNAGLRLPYANSISRLRLVLDTGVST
jgi:hypothetical protein